EPEEGTYPFDLAWSGYLRTSYEAIEDDLEQTDFVGLNDGFVLNNARVTLDGSYADLGFRIQFDGVSGVGSGRESRVRTQLLDANATWAPLSELRLTLGRFRPPFDAEQRTPNADLPFVSRAVGVRGVLSVE